MQGTQNGQLNGLGTLDVVIRQANHEEFCALTELLRELDHPYRVTFLKEFVKGNFYVFVFQETDDVTLHNMQGMNATCILQTARAFCVVENDLFQFFWIAPHLNHLAPQFHLLLRLHFPEAHDNGFAFLV